MPLSAKANDARPLSAGNAAKRILLVEDDPDLTVLLRDYLEAHFYQLTIVANGADGLRAVMDCDYDVILCDIMMPKMPGDMFYYAVHRVKPHLCERFIFMTAQGEIPRAKEFLNRTTEMVLTKPFHLDDLLETILLLFRELEDTTNKLNVPEESLVLAPAPPPQELPYRLPA